MAHPHLEEIRALARHEAGHYVINRHLGFSPSAITLRIKGPLVHYPGTSIWLPDHEASCFVEMDEELPSTTLVQAWLERRIRSLFAGSLAQAMTGDHPDADLTKEILRANGATDQKVIEAFVFLIRNVEGTMLGSPEERAKRKQEIMEQQLATAAALVTAAAPVIHALAEIVVTRALGGSGDPKEPAPTGVLPGHIIERVGAFRGWFGSPVTP